MGTRLLWRNVAASIFREEVGDTVFLLRIIHTYHAIPLPCHAEKG
jgi:hypothetical protein